MPDTIDALFAFIFAGAAVWTLVPATESLARRIGDRAIDYPNERSLHEFPTPKLGGLAVLVAVLIGGSIFLPWDQETRSILAGAIVITAVGVIDDLVDLPAGVKLLGQTAAAIIPVASGVTVDSFTASLPRPDRSRLGRALQPAGDRRHRPRPGPDRRRHRRRRQRDQPDRRGRRPRGGRLPDLGGRARRDRAVAGPQRRGSAGGGHGGRVAGLPAPRLPSGIELHGGHRQQPARLPDGGGHRPGGAEDQRGRRPLLPARGARRPHPRHGLRGRQAAQVQPADLSRRHRALPPPDGAHRLQPAADHRLPVRLDPGPRRRCARPALRPVHATTTATSTPSGRPSWRSACWVRWPRAST